MTAPRTGQWPGFVARVATPCTPEKLAQIIADAWPAVIGTEVSHGELLAVLAQILLETGTRQIDRDRDGDVDEEDQVPGFWNGNAGNIRGTFQGFWTSFRAGEGFGANEVILEPGPANRFRSYLGPTDDPTAPEALAAANALGVPDLIALLERKYPKALAAARRGDFHGYVMELHVGGYFTANPKTYETTEQTLARTVEQLPLIAAYLPIYSPEPERLET